jgi:predicted dehydrogenase
MTIRFSRRSCLASAGLAVWGCSRWTHAAEKPPLRIGQIGTRHSHASGKMEALRHLTQLYQVIGIAENDPKSAENAKRNKAYAELAWHEEAALLADAKIEVVAVETTLEDSTATALRAIQAGKHIHLDKPGGSDHAPFRAMRLGAERRGLQVQMGYMLRHNPAFSLLFRAARAGWFGEILEITATMGKQADAGLRRSLATIPGQGMFELGCHLIDAIVTVLGAPTKVTAWGTASPTAADPLIDNQLAVLEYPRALAVVRSHHNDPGGTARRAFTLVGTHGSMDIAPLESGKAILRLTKACDEFAAGEHKLALPLPRGRYDEEFIALAKWVRGTEKCPWTAKHDIQVHATALQAAGCKLS